MKNVFKAALIAPFLVFLDVAADTIAPHEYPEPVCDTWRAVDDATPTLSDYVERTPDLSTLLAALKATNLSDVLSFPGPINLFAPSNYAFEVLLAEYGVSAEELLSETDLLARLLQYHVVVEGATCDADGGIEIGDSAISGLPSTIETGLPGEYLAIDANNVAVIDANGNTADVVGVWIAGNGVVFVVNRVLLPTEDEEARALALQKLSQFSSVDADGNGFIQEAELVAAAASVGVQLTSQQLEAFSRADANGNGVDDEEYVVFLSEALEAITLSGLAVTNTDPEDVPPGTFGF